MSILYLCFLWVSLHMTEAFCAGHTSMDQVWKATEFAVRVKSQYKFDYNKDAAVQVVDVSQLVSLINKSAPGIRVINFWATWCKPCIEELPYIDKINDESAFEDVEVLLVSVDFIEDLETKVKKFITREDIQSRVLLVDNTDYNSWIDKVDPEWSGAIPATLIIQPETGKRKFYEKQLKDGELEQILFEFKNQ